MCRRAEAVDHLAAAARCLSEACATRIGTRIALQETYGRIVAEPVPSKFAELIERLGAGEGAKA